MTTIHLVGTADTKGAELAFLKAILDDAGAKVVIVDLGIRAPTIPVNVTAADVAACDPDFDQGVFTADDRGSAVAAMSRAFRLYCERHQQEISGILGIGGGGGTSIVSAGLRALPYGTPKLIVSTLASGDTAAFVGVSDIVMMPAITDLAGLNRVSRRVLHNAAHAILGMTANPAPAFADSKPAVGLSMFGVTTPCVTQISEFISGQFDPLIFHATGTGGQTMERLVQDGSIAGLIDVTLTEVCDLLVGGVLPCLQERLNVVADKEIPWVGSPGALDMVNFWAPETVPNRFKDRQFYYHNPNVTLMRTTPAENAEMGQWIGEKLNACSGPVTLFIPEKGVSMLDAEGGDFWWPEADAALFDSLKTTIRQTAKRNIVSLPLHINDPEFSLALANEFRTPLGS
ncbi:MAG: Tm-1-like ATP-binding domain-containing protein [Ruegeria sp.]